MSHENSPPEQRPSLAVTEQAALWLIRLHSPERNAALEAEFNQWLRADASHARAFEGVTELWEHTARLRPEHFPDRKKPARMRLSRRAAVLTAVFGILIAAGVVKYFSAPGTAQSLETLVGEQRSVTLADQTVVRLNTDTRVIVDFSGPDRRIYLTKGEAEFAVARQPARRFVVMVNGNEVIALGTSFVVRRDEGKSTVILTSGNIKVIPALAAPDREDEQRLEDEGIVLEQGQRVVLEPGRKPIVDRPNLNEVVGWGWQKKLITFDNAPLSEVVTEINRYSDVPVIIQDPEVAKLRLTARYRIDDVFKFLKEAAGILGLVAEKKDGYILLSRAGRPPASTSPKAGKPAGVTSAKPDTSITASKAAPRHACDNRQAEC